MARSMGADNFLTPDPERSFPDQVAAALGGPADIVFDCAGAPGSLDQAVSAVRRYGTIASPGFCWVPDSFSPLWAMLKDVTIRFTNMYNTRDFETAIGALDQGHVAPRTMVTDVVTLNEAPAAFEMLLERNHQCKVMIRPV